MKNKRFKDRVLSFKLSFVIGGMLVPILLILIGVSVVLSRNAVTDGVYGEFTGIAQQNGIMVQTIIDTAASCSKNLQTYIEDQYASKNQSTGRSNVESSLVYPVKLGKEAADIEQYILNVAWPTVGNSEDIVGLGAFFEPGAFDQAKQDYSLYVGNEEAANKTARSYGTYSEYGSQSYYKLAATAKKAVLTEPYIDNGITMITVAYPILIDQEVKGVITVDINVDNFSKIKTEDKKYPTMLVDVYNENGMMVFDSESKEYVGKTLVDTIGEKQFSLIKAEMDKKQSFSIKTLKDDGSKLVRFFYPIEAGEVTWWAASALEEKDLNKDVNKLVLIMVLMAIGALVLIIAAIVLLLKKFLNPINPIVAATNQLAVGDFDIALKAESDDEIGMMSKAFSETVKNLKEIIKDLTRGISSMAEGNFDIAPEVEYVGAFEEIKVSLASFLMQISRTLRDIEIAAEQVAEGADQISTGAQSLTEGATDQASSIEELQATVTNVSSEVDNNAQQAKDASQMAKNVGDEIIDSNGQMQQMVAAMQEITSTSNQISNIINTINDIAEQTNLLALNASIEAARAGDAGRGFAVVATEVGNLAAQCSDAAKDSTSLISDSMKAVANGKSIADQTAERLLKSQEKTVELVGAIEVISNLSEKQALALEQITQAVEQIASIVEENTAMAQESSASSEELASQSQLLKQLVDRFKLNSHI